MPQAPVLCIFGTGSDVGKSWITAGLCRVFANSNVNVTPYKAQNMSNNAGVTPAGLEMGRAQIVQAIASRQVPHVDMNPLLLKPNTDTGAQVVALGKVVGNMSARDYFRGGPAAVRRRQLVTQALDRLRDQYALVIAEGAGSCAEVNLRDRDLVNMPIAHHSDGQVIVVADIHKGGVFAQCVGTLACMPPHDRARVRGFIINRFRGDPALFDDGRAWIEATTGLPVLGLVPWAADIDIEQEDGLPPDVQVDGPPPVNRSRAHVAVLRLPHISNFTDFDALGQHDVDVHYLATPRSLEPYDLVIVPGSKNTRGDLAWVRRLGWDALLKDRASRGGAILGICGGFQILGERIVDSHGVEGPPGEVTGLGLLAAQTVMARKKTTRRSSGMLGNVRVEGYEIHVGETVVSGEPMLWLHTEQTDLGGRRLDGARSGSVSGTYLHGLFDQPGVVAAILGPIRPDLSWPERPSQSEWRDQQLNRLADHLRSHVDMDALAGIIGLTAPQ